MKPDWKDAPDWANYLASNRFHEWWWFEHKPQPSEIRQGYHPEFGKTRKCNHYLDWRESLEARPE